MFERALKASPRARYEELAAEFQQAHSEFSALEKVADAKTGNFDQIKAAFGTAGQSCKACHDNYREK